MELKDTIDGMISNDYRERFKAEYRQTKERYERLKGFCNRIEAAERTGREEPRHDCPLELLREHGDPGGDRADRSEQVTGEGE